MRENERHRRSGSAAALPALGHALAGSLSTALSHLLTYPLDLVITRLQVQQRHGESKAQPTSEKSRADVEYGGVLDAARKIYNRGGGDWKAFYSGVEYDVFKSMADAFLFFLAYTFLRQKRLKRKGTRSLTIAEELLIGMLAGAFGKAFTTPMQIIITRKQMMDVKSPSSSRDPSMSKNGAVTGPEKASDGSGSKSGEARAIMKQIYRRKGLKGFWAGYTATLVLTLNPSLTFLLHRVFSRLLLSRSRRTRPGSLITFLMAALSKAVSSTITYPFSLAKARLQAEDAGSSSDGYASSKANTGNFQRTIFHSVARIMNEDGFGALYAGVEGEVLKGFISHGNTMAIKERVHTMVVRLYIYIFRFLKQRIGTNEFLDDDFHRMKID